MALICDTITSGDNTICSTSAGGEAAVILVVVGSIIGMLFGLYQYLVIKAIHMPEPNTKPADDLIEFTNKGAESKKLLNEGGSESDSTVRHENFLQLNTIYGVVNEGARAFLYAQYTRCVVFTFGFAIVILILTSSSSKLEGDTGHKKSVHTWEWNVGALTAISFTVGALTSILAGYIGMIVAVYANGKVCIEAVKPEAEGWSGAFKAAFVAGSVMGFALCGLALIVLFILIEVYASLDTLYTMDYGTGDNESTGTSQKRLFECIAGYGLGGSSMALFDRVGGGIFTKAADVGADLSGKVAGVTINGQKLMLDEDSPHNPATIADNVGDNVGDVAGMGSDLFGSFAEASCAALVISASSPELVSVGVGAFMFPLLISAAGIVVCMLTSFIATHVQKVESAQGIECVLKVQLFVSALLMTLATLPLALCFLPEKFTFEDFYQINTNANPGFQEVKAIGAWISVICGLWGGCLIGFITEYYTSHSYTPVQEVANSCASGAATNIIYGLALGYLSNILPILILAVDVYVSFTLCGMYGVALAALGMLGTLSTCLSIDVYGPIADNAGGLAEMAEFPGFVRDKTDALDAAGNITAAIGKGFAIGSAALVSLALFGGFTARLGAHLDKTKTTQVVIDVLRPITFAFLFLGAMLPYWFTAYCMKSVGVAADRMVKNVKEQFQQYGKYFMEGIYENGELVGATNKKYLEDCKLSEADKQKNGGKATGPKNFPDYQACIHVSTEESLREMVKPAMLVIFSPILTGAFFGVEAVSGLLVGSLISAVQLAISQSNSGGAWDNAKKYVEAGHVYIEIEITKEFAEQFPSITIMEEDCGTEHAQCFKEPQDRVTAELVKPDNEDPKICKVKQAKKTELHKAAVTGDTVGDPLKDTSGPALNIVMKLMAILSLVFSDFFVSINHGRGIFNIATSLDLSCTTSGCPDQ